MIWKYTETYEVNDIIMLIKLRVFKRVLIEVPNESQSGYILHLCVDGYHDNICVQNQMNHQQEFQLITSKEEGDKFKLQSCFILHPVEREVANEIECLKAEIAMKDQIIRDLKIQLGEMEIVNGPL